MLGVVVVVLAGALAWNLLQSPSQPVAPNTPTNGESVDRDIARVNSLVESGATPEERLPDDVAVVESEDLVIAVGMVTLEDDWGNQLHRIPAAVFSSNWIALPRISCLGATRWTFRPGEAQQSSVSQGDWRTGDAVGLWRLDETTFESPELAAWERNEELTWLSFVDGRRIENVQVSYVETREGFSWFEPTQNLGKPGVLVQGSFLVGWTFGEYGPPGAWLWDGVDGQDLRVGLRVQDFYRLTFAGGREEMFAQAISKSDRLSTLERLQAFTRGLRNSPRLLAEETPRELRQSQVLVGMKLIIGELLHSKSGLGPSVLQLFDVATVEQAGDSQLLLALVTAELDHFGPEGALRLLQGAGPSLIPSGSAEDQIAVSLEQKIYNEWLQQLLADQSIATGWDVWREARGRLPRDPEIHLRGVELALAELDWRDAESRLLARQYPARLSDLVKVLQSQISRLKGEEGRIVIRFTPGANIIPTTATLNGTAAQDFLIDTGASRTTIPKRMAQRLGLRSTGEQVRVSTAGGILTVPQVRVDSITLGGWEVRDVDVLVLDLPGSPELGLIGLNYLNRFRMDLKVDEGTLILEPR